ncbi:hypothetical protein [Nocardioides sp. zg-1230]|uniref:hypothetical protein n=1 Tax=Nocardioides sp. zg-1230 TaxID=2736601 RepID=UPI00155302C2|nr:hypothetical protein [Nocardioides sp. zg-1230]NPC42155.1 hypothetical protein [Nocardioides sp. zg-1230]
MRRLAPLSAAAAAATLLAVAAGGGPATAKPIDSGTIHEEFSFVVTGFCGVDDLDVEVESVNDFRFRLGSRGAAQLPYFLEQATVHQTITSPDDDRFVTYASRTIGKDLKVTDNGDGTFTILVLGTGNETWYGMDGKAIARNPGQSRWEILIDNNGTPQDPSDDEFLEFLGDVKGSTGRTDDACAAMVAELT